ncbi:retinol dehydrogenase 14-like [Leptopilina heterotoma]|uniref:retinol dehydrogenase 14-like n=1 Tax=Leptopilina heterotoma TaxID=63436 RepID=UPI001CA8BEA7|nr:retinol dehydrogenase 14-like [Leptopilina heterotoma]
MVSTFCYVLLPVVFIIGLLRKCREYSWGRYKDKEVDLSDRVFIVTGANSGIGKETTRELVKRKAKVIMACRNMENARKAIDDIRTQVTSGELIPMELDLSSLKSVRNFATQVLNDFPKINVLINNAGVYVPLKEHAFTENGFEIHFGINHLGHFLLTYLLLDKLKESAPSRIVIVTSKLLESGTIDFDNLNGEKGLTTEGRMNPSYCNSKLANVYFAIDLARRMKDTGVSVHSVCPGFTYTGLFRHVKRSWLHYIIFSPIALLYLRTSNQGAQTIVYCALSPTLENESGNIYRDCNLYEPKKILDPEIATKLWDVSAKLTKITN